MHTRSLRISVSSATVVVLLAATATAIGAPPSGGGGTPSDMTLSRSGGVVRIDDTTGGTDRLTVGRTTGPTDAQLRVDSGKLAKNSSIPNVGAAAPEGCDQFATNELRCAAVTSVQVRLDAGDDSAQAFNVVPGPPLPVKFNGGDGNDSLTGSDGADTLNGGPGIDSANGDAGADTIAATTNDSVRGGPGDDNVNAPLGFTSLEGNQGVDTLDFAQVGTQGVTATLGDGEANGPNDAGGGDVAGDFETVLGSPGADDITGADGAETLVGAEGADRLDGRGGQDHLNGAGGDDLLLSRDGLVDSVNCGDGANDRAVGDANDVYLGCETIEDGSDALPAGIAPVPGVPAGQTGAGGGVNGAQPPELQIVSATVPVLKSGKGAVIVRCVYRAKACKGSIDIVSAGRVRAGKKLSIKKGEKIGSAKLSEIPWGKSAPVKVALSRKARGLVKAGKRVPTRVTVRASDAGATGRAAEAKVTRTVRLTPQPRKPRKLKK